MKNKKLTYFVLFPAVIVVWGLIVYKIIVRDNNYIKENSIPAPSLKEEQLHPIKEYQLLNNYPDPFFGKNTRPVKKHKKAVGTPVPVSATKYKWPDIRYNGYILNGDIVKAHITVKGENRILGTDEIFGDGHIITSITKDSIRVKYKSNIKWFSKK